jgi:hypothetical protein
METEIKVKPAIATAEPITQTPVASNNSGGDDVFENVGSQKPMDFKSLLLFGLLIAYSIYGITYYRKAIAKLNDDNSKDDFLNLVDDVEEVKYNVKKALGKKYSTT